MLNKIINANIKINDLGIFVLLFFILSNFDSFLNLFFSVEILSSNTFLLLSMVFSLIHIALLIYKNKISRNKLLFIFSYIFLILLTFFAQKIFYSNFFGSHDILLSFLTGSLIWFIIGLSLANLKININNIFSLLLNLTIMGMILLNLDGNLVISYGDIASNNNLDFSASHLTVGNSAIIIVLLSFCLSRKYEYINFLLGLIIFFTLGGRSNFLIFISSILIYWLLKKQYKFVLLSFSSILIINITSLSYFKFFHPDELVERMFNALTVKGLENDESFIARADIFEKSIDNLDSQFLFGNTEEIVKNLGAFGYYQHNILSFWQFYGFLVFCFILFFIVNKFYIIIKYAVNKEDVLNNFGIILFIFCVFSVFITKSANFYPFWLCMGFWLAKDKQFEEVRRIR